MQKQSRTSRARSRICTGILSIRKKFRHRFILQSCFMLFCRRSLQLSASQLQTLQRESMKTSRRSTRVAGSSHNSKLLKVKENTQLKRAVNSSRKQQSTVEAVEQQMTRTRTGSATQMQSPRELFGIIQQQRATWTTIGIILKTMTTSMTTTTTCPRSK